jgi:PTS system ascorbate-specific IIA component
MTASAASLSDLLPLQAIRIGAAPSDWRGAIRASGDALVASGATTPAYTDQMVATVEELGPYIVIAPGIALAHSRPSPAVLHAGMSIVTLAQPVEFGHQRNDPVRLVVGLAGPDEEGHVKALATLAEFLSDTSRRERLLQAATPREVAGLVRDFEMEQAADAGLRDTEAQEART